MLVDALEHLVRGIVANPDDVDVSTRRGRNRGTTLDVRVHPDDMGRVIGRAGRTATLLRKVVRALSKKLPVSTDFVGVDGR